MVCCQFGGSSHHTNIMEPSIIFGSTNSCQYWQDKVKKHIKDWVIMWKKTFTKCQSSNYMAFLSLSCIFKQPLLPLTKKEKVRNCQDKSFTIWTLSCCRECFHSFKQCPWCCQETIKSTVWCSASSIHWASCGQLCCQKPPCHPKLLCPAQWQSILLLQWRGPVQEHWPCRKGHGWWSRTSCQNLESCHLQRTGWWHNCILKG